MSKKELHATLSAMNSARYAICLDWEKERNTFVNIEKNLPKSERSDEKTGAPKIGGLSSQRTRHGTAGNLPFVCEQRPVSQHLTRRRLLCNLYFARNRSLPAQRYTLYPFFPALASVCTRLCGNIFVRKQHAVKTIYFAPAKQLHRARSFAIISMISDQLHMEKRP